MRTGTGRLLQAFLAVGYVSSIYVHPNGRLRFQHQTSRGDTKIRSRNDPSVIRTRLIAVCVATALSCLIVGYAVWNDAAGALTPTQATYATAELLGLRPNLRTWRDFLPYLIVPVLYMGPLFTLLLDSALPFQRHSSLREDVVTTLTTLRGLRNYVISPITEELVFRSCIIGVSKLTNESWNVMVFVSPLWFGVAHLHHAWETWNNLGRNNRAASTAIISALFQLGYTTLFGWFTAYLLTRTGSVYAACFSHIFCNIMGLPTLNQDIKDHPRFVLMIWCMHILGIIGFIWALVPWTAVA
ncbi:hypothetical protein DL93DRAFT_2190181 [Clavulina sp. PMI_390]|nr:hypothetical protein DL93DRAFT_2190181 [Clavulina sp. PMI_390]